VVEKMWGGEGLYLKREEYSLKANEEENKQKRLKLGGGHHISKKRWIQEPNTKVVRVGV